MYMFMHVGRTSTSLEKSVLFLGLWGFRCYGFWVKAIRAKFRVWGFRELCQG